MISKLSALLTQYICKKNTYDLSLDNIEKINYAIIIILGETFKLFFLFFLFASLGTINYFTFSLLILLSIRIFAGGFHAENSIKCILFSTLFFLCTCIFIFWIPNLSRMNYYIISAASIILNIIYSPLPSKNRPIISIKRKRHLKFISVISTIIWIYVLFFFIEDRTMFKCGIFTIFLQSIQLLIFRKGRDSNEK
ncbi:accessory gene regulator ArgB-like protein [Clostridium sp. WILCCON 0269]|uniref:Accessory gene regulator ArgB-like protein n=1 Tax=Candidatus Clostridium eludens TaxID=3381663 RepID=A0ABW8SMR3_9CLOT